MSDEIQDQIEHVAELIRDGNEPYVQPGTTVMMTVADEQVPVGIVIGAYQALAMQVASIAAEMETNAEAKAQRAKHPWSLTVQNVLVAFFALAFILVLFKGWPS